MTYQHELYGVSPALMVNDTASCRPDRSIITSPLMLSGITSGSSDLMIIQYYLHLCYSNVTAV